MTQNFKGDTFSKAHYFLVFIRQISWVYGNMAHFRCNSSLILPILFYSSCLYQGQQSMLPFDGYFGGANLAGNYTLED